METTGKFNVMQQHDRIPIIHLSSVKEKKKRERLHPDVDMGEKKMGQLLLFYCERKKNFISLFFIIILQFLRCQF
jgi:hypothetical protein